MDFTVITTYRCNSKCSMCHVWQNPSHPAEEVDMKTLEKIPFGIDHLNLTGGEPTLRGDLAQMVDLLHPRARKLEISTNGLRWQTLKAVIRKYPDIKVRFSLEGLGEVNDRIRGEAGGFERKVEGVKQLKELGGCDLGFAAVIQDDNAADLLPLYRLAQGMGVELATSVLHNAFQFHKADNYPYDRLRGAGAIEGLILEMLKTASVKNWFRAYLNLGLVEKVLGRPRLIPCSAGTDFVFLDPWGDVYACNVRPDLIMGNLVEQDWEEITSGTAAVEARDRVAACGHNCWMVGSARTAMRHPRFTRLPKFGPLWWVLVNKARVTLGLRVPFERYVDASAAGSLPAGSPRRSYLGEGGVKRRLQRRDEAHYTQFGEFDNY